MTMTDPIADMLTRLRNANQAYHESTSMPYSKIKQGIADILQQEGYRVVAAGHGAEALDRLEKHHVDLVLSDISMPVMDGYALYERIRAKGKSHKVAIIACIGKMLAILNAIIRSKKPFDPKFATP